ncbi:MAG: His-Xaa-Ser system radical SAM maturase HxsB [Myxococcaceae bacterium]
MTTATHSNAYDITPLAPKLDAQSQAFFRFRQVGQKVLITNLEGFWLLLSPDEFQRFATGTVEAGSPLFKRLSDNNFLRASYDTRKAADRLWQRRQALAQGPNLHMLVVTLRCNESCIYCHASRATMDQVQTDMSKETAEKAVDLILQSPNPNLTIEFQGGEPLVAFDVVKHVITYANEKNKKAGKQLEFTMVTNLSLMDEEKLQFLLANRVQICTSIDGPEHLHDLQRKLPGGKAHELAVKWIRRINQAWADQGLDPTLYRVEALLTTTRDALPLWKEIVDTYVDLGCRALFLRPVDPFGWAEKTERKVEYPREDFLEFYKNVVDYMLELNGKGVQVLERYAAIFLSKFFGKDPNFLDLRTPAGAGIGALAYNYDGRIFTSDEGRMLHEMGDSSFLIGDVRKSSWRDLMGHPTVRAEVLASNIDGQPDCINCTYNPYCGTQTAHNHKKFGTLFGRARESTLCAVHKGIQDYLFERLASEDPKTLDIFQKWTTNRPRTHFLQPGS